MIRKQIMTDDQKHALELIKTSADVCILGVAGTGKTALIEMFQDILIHKKLAF